MSIEDMAAELSVNATASGKREDSRKRHLDEDSENGVAKKSHYGGDVRCNLKILVPSVVVGGIIGKGGETLVQLQKDCDVRIIMSKTNDFYPGTLDRVCLITGGVEAITEAFKFILKKILEKNYAPNITHSDTEKAAYELGKLNNIQMKILVPNSTAGMIIGKGGNYISQIKEYSGAQVQLSQKARDKSLLERCITVTGGEHNIIKATDMILSKILEDPNSNSCLNISYSVSSVPVANNNPCGSPFALSKRPHTSIFPIFNSVNDDMTSLVTMHADSGSINLSLNLGAPCRGTSITSQLIEHIKFTLQGSGYNDQATSDIIAAMVTLAKYGILGMGLGVTQNAGPTVMPNSSLQSPGCYLGSDALDNAYTKFSNNAFYNHDLNEVINSNVPRNENLNSTSNLNVLDQFKGTRQLPSSLSLPQNLDSTETSEDHKSIDLQVPENIVGAIIGPGGRSLIEIQFKSGAKIQISEKGKFAPGTRSRLVTITGCKCAVDTAKFLVEKRVAEEERKRARSQTNIQLN